ncbi:OsmC family protein [Paeniglutamicibacter psychrophenolicus]|uniref:OsmC-like protein n=1 Tax=Paeniglutamicibacter psychrophenolicus TaxID=257454 RepID=A0ABS4WJR9_9MICC|nr:OsmC family protein [Paeniglutamicibacter psychrophenolicus]MBP2376439.1 putative OsmC-like protein [Paeniglutamicibacter psychrophenolicus]
MSSDEPTALLGTDSAVSPGEYIAQALAGCYAVTLAASATALGINLRAMAMDIEIDFDLRAFLGIETTTPAGARTIRAQVKLDAPDSSPEQLKKLMGLLEQRSPIRDTLTRAVEVITTLESL